MGQAPHASGSSLLMSLGGSPRHARLNPALDLCHRKHLHHSHPCQSLRLCFEVSDTKTYPLVICSIFFAIEMLKSLNCKFVKYPCGIKWLFHLKGWLCGSFKHREYWWWWLSWMLSELDMSHSQTIPLTKAADVNLKSVCKCPFSDKCVSAQLSDLSVWAFSQISWMKTAQSLKLVQKPVSCSNTQERQAFRPWLTKAWV